ncbi:phospholipase D-like domain-containing protein [Flavitalea antarctica]
MKIEHITNSLILFQEELAKQLQGCTEFQIASVFIGAPGIDLLESCLQSNKSLRECRLLVGMYGSFNSKKDLSRLLKLVQKYPFKLQVNVSRNQSMHWKYYNFKMPFSRVIFIGSANMTSGGLGNNSELMLKLSCRSKKDSSFDKLATSFNKVWEQSTSLSAFPLQQYKEVARTSLRSSVHDAVRNFFQTKTAPIKGIDRANRSVCVTYLTTDLKNSTSQSVVGYNSRWATKNFFVCQDKTHFEKCLKAGRILIIWKYSPTRHSFFWAAMTDSLNTIATSEGKYFIAYKTLGSEIRLTPAKQIILAEKFGINLRARKNIFKGKLLKEEEANQFMKLF